MCFHNAKVRLWKIGLDKKETDDGQSESEGSVCAPVADFHVLTLPGASFVYPLFHATR